MEIRRVNPGQAGAIGVPVRVARSNAGDIANAAAGAVNAKARGVSSLIDAAGNLGESVSKFSAAKAKMASDNATFQSKAIEANYVSNSRLIASKYKAELASKAMSMRPYYEEDDATFTARTTQMLRNVRANAVKASTTPRFVDGKANPESNGIGYQVKDPVLLERLDRDLAAVDAKFMQEQMATRTKVLAKIQEGKSEETGSEMAASGNTRLDDYRTFFNTTLGHLRTPTEIEIISKEFHKKGCIADYTNKINTVKSVAASTYNQTVDALVAEGHSFEYANAVGLREARRVIGMMPTVESLDYGDIIPKETDVKLQKSLADGLKSLENSKKAESNAVIIEDWKRVASGQTGSFAESKVLFDALNADSVYGDSIAVSAVLGLEDGQTAVFDQGQAYVAYSNDLSLLDLENSDDRKRAVAILKEASVLEPSAFAALQNQAKSQIASIGKGVSVASIKPDIVAFLSRKGVPYTGKDSDSASVKSLAATCLKYAKNNPAQWEMVCDNVVREWESVEQLRESAGEVGSILFSTFNDSTTGGTIVRGGARYPTPSFISQTDYGKRPDGTDKGHGFFGEVRRNGQVITEFSTTVDWGDGDVLIPLLVPTLDHEEFEYITSVAAGSGKRNEEMNKRVLSKAEAHARERKAQGKSVFVEEGERLVQPPQKPTNVRNQALENVMRERSAM